MTRTLLTLALLGLGLGAATWRRPVARQSRLHGWGWLLPGFLGQVVWVRLLSTHKAVPECLVWLPCLALAPALRFIWLNRVYRGLWVLALGAGLNGLAMAANGGLMPLSSTILSHLDGAAPHALGMALRLTKNRVLVPGHIPFAALGDRLSWTIGGVRAVVSVGDLLVCTGAVLTLLQEVWQIAASLRMTLIHVVEGRQGRQG